jgi:hypothetical protein
MIRFLFFLASLVNINLAFKYVTKRSQQYTPKPHLLASQELANYYEDIQTIPIKTQFNDEDELASLIKLGKK